MISMQYSERFLNFVQQQLTSFQADHELEHVVVYVARSGDSGSPTLEVVGQWPQLEKVLQPVETDTALRTPSSNRRWYPLQEGSILLGVIRAERIPSDDEWTEFLDQRLQSMSISLANSPLISQSPGGNVKSPFNHGSINIRKLFNSINQLLEP